MAATYTVLACYLVNSVTLLPLMKVLLSLPKPKTLYSTFALQLFRNAYSAPTPATQPLAVPPADTNCMPKALALAET